ncbi:c-type cytochrome [Primorskyibacter sp. S187A]|uniref:c-type cytochrome n=1 Tax=Primorskyibacter sp. S187A TaxID=3415130 RepID=UPI003C7A7AB3
MKLSHIALALGITACATTAVAQDFKNQVKARQGQFQIMALSLAELGAMAKGEVEYSEEAAKAAAMSIAGIAMVNPATLWVEGSDNMSIDGTRALPSIWDDNADFVAKWGAFTSAAAGMPDAVTGGVQNVGPALGKVGASCKSCHEAHRAPAN